MVPSEARANTEIKENTEEEEEEEGPRVQMQRIFALRNDIHSSRREFEKEFRDRKKKLKAGLKKVKADIKTEEKNSGNSDFQKQTQVLDENMKRMAETIRKDEEETKELCARTSELLARVAEVKEKVEAGVLELRASMEQEAKVRRELLEQKNVLSDDIAQLKQLLASMQDDLMDDEGVHRSEVERLGMEGVEEANHLRHELVGIRMDELGQEMAKLRDDIANTERLIDDASRALKEKEADRSGLVEMQEALNAKLQSCQCDQTEVEAIEAELALLEDKMQMLNHSCETIGRCMESYQLKIDAARARIAEVQQEENVNRDPLVCATPRESALMHGALVGASHHSTAVCLHPEVGEACAVLASTTNYTGRLDSENMGLDLAAEPSKVPEDISDDSALALPPLPPCEQTAAPEVSAEWTERRAAALSAATRPVSTPHKVRPHEVITLDPAQTQTQTQTADKLEDAKSSLESMQALQQELEEWQSVLEAKIKKMETSGDDEEDINTMRSELDTVKEKLGMHIKDIANVTEEIRQIESDM